VTSNEELERRKAEKVALDEARAKRDAEARARRDDRVAEQEAQRRKDRGQT
jgi:hypothetical protein